MFPEPLRNATYTTVVGTQAGIKYAYNFSRSATWIIFSTSIILFAPVIFEVERAQMEEMQKNQQKQVKVYCAYCSVPALFVRNFYCENTLAFSKLSMNAGIQIVL